MSGMPSPSPARINGGDRDKDSMWYFSSDDLSNSPSRKAGISPDQELSYRQMTAYLIQEMGQRLQVSQLCINTAIVYMHRFYAFHSFTHFHRNGIAAASLFLAAKVEEQPRKLEHVIKAANKCLNQPTTSTTDTYYLEQAQDLVFNENVLLQTLGFDVAIDHPHTHVVKTCQLVKACKDLAQTSYFLASNSLHLTSMCLQYKPSVVACFCIYLACKWSRWEIPQSTEGKHWFHYVDETVTMDLLKKLTDEFIAIYEKSPARLKSKLNSIKALAQGASNRQGQVKDKKADQDWKVSDMMNMKMYHPAETVVNSSSQSQSSSSLYSSQGSSGGDSLSQQQVGSMSQTMLPPPPHQAQQMRKPELHSSSQHRSHHSTSSSSSSSHHPPKIGYSTADIPDHKLNAGHGKQQQQPQPYGVSNIVSNRPPREHNAAMMASAANKSSSSSSSSSRSSISNSMTGPQNRQSTSQGHSMEVSYHKSRERSLAVPPASSGHTIPPHSISHKMGQKQDGNRSVSSKDHTGRLAAEQVNKQSNANSSNKMFSSSVSSQYGGNSLQIPPGTNNNSQLPSKLDTMHDITRNLIHPSRAGYNNQPPPQPLSNGPAVTLLNFHQQQQQQGSRHNSTNISGNNNSSSSLKHEQSKQISVHMQQQSQTMTHHHKQQQPPPADQSYSGLSASHDLYQQSHITPSLVSNNYSKIEPLQHSEEPSHPNNPCNQEPQSHTAKMSSSLFSPVWNDKIQVHQSEIQMSQQLQPPNQSGCGLNSFVNSCGNLTQSSEVYQTSGYKIPSTSVNNKESSPPKIKIERDTTSKKDKNRSNSSNLEGTGRSAGAHASTQAQVIKTSGTKKMDSSLAGLNELAITSNMGTVGGIKRVNELVAIKQEDDIIMRDSKVRKIDAASSNDVSKHQVVNGIETNPDLVRNLLKESLCCTSGLLKTEPSIITPSLQPPAELFEPSATTSLNNQQNTSLTSVNNNVLSGNSDVSVMETDEHSTSGSKSEKKKKKDKHKHKEKDKDKSKDREERKKHKKDKDRHKDKERDRDNDNVNSSTVGAAEHVKIKISKEKLEASGEPIGFKIKIPKDRIMGDINTSASSGQINTDSVASHAPPVLKIKISKDKLESYNSGSTELISGLTATTHPSYAHAFSSYSAPSSHTNPSTATHISSSNNKKKDRDREKDRERDKDKKRNHESTSSSSRFSGGNGGSHGSLIAAGITGSNAANGSIAAQNHSTSNSSGNSTTQKYSSKMHHQSNMSLLFGESNESNDDDDDYNDDF